MPLTEKHWSIILSIVGTIAIVLIYGLSVYFVEKRYARQDAERMREWKKLFASEFPEPASPKGQAN